MLLAVKLQKCIYIKLTLLVVICLALRKSVIVLFVVSQRPYYLLFSCNVIYIIIIFTHFTYLYIECFIGLKMTILRILILIVF
jgi:hypothetical protein